ncbi:MAG: hypothetical protein ABW034_23740 [Steroidobacteraceae bacterium]
MADVTRPNGATQTLSFTPEAEGNFTADFATKVPGVYRFRIRARGTTPRGEPFTREKTLTAAVWRGGDRPGPQGGGSNTPDGDTSGGSDVSSLCKLIACVLQRDGVISPELEKRLREAGVNLERLRECVAKYCRRDCNC